MNQTLRQIERYVTQAMDHLTEALEPVVPESRPMHLIMAAECFLRCVQALWSQLAWERFEARERQR